MLQTYGAGNGPSKRKDLLDELKRASRRGVIIVNCTQCSLGQVEATYETGSVCLLLYLQYLLLDVYFYAK